MSKIAIITDSSCDLPKDLVAKLGISVVPLRVIYKSGEFRDGIDIEPTYIYERLEIEVPTTSMPSPEDIYATFEKVRSEGFTHCLVISVSSGLSGTYNTFKLIASEFEDLHIHVIDSKYLSWALGYQVIEAAKLVREKLDFGDIVQKIEAMKKQISAYFVVDTLDYLKAGGRIGRVSALFGSMLNVKPIISVDDDGKYFPLTVARGKKQAMKKLCQLVQDHVESAKASIAIVQGRAEKEAEAFADRIRQLGDNITDIYVGNVSPALVVHAGPGLVGLIIKSEK
ncbi:DegV family protein [Baia soyae]|uniref:DegV family protein with EDD domain n=1 Tax=Baia soyae TaxID=1544746 RepID=A0A4R2SGH5_9BACL|nr:DegV family protein [Baia soyae]TCP70620.1 DegV family protein with EDD domain [Baia soyae]